MRYGRSYDTLNRVYGIYASLTTEDLQAAAKKYFTEPGLVVATVSQQPLPEAMAKLPAFASLAPGTPPQSAAPR